MREVLALLENVEANWHNRDSSFASAELDKLKVEALQVGDQKRAKELWCLEQVLNIQDQYIDAFKMMKEAKYYDAWNKLERVEIDIGALDKHFEDRNNRYLIDFIYTHTERFQFIYPYKVFTSPEFVKKEVGCSVCDAIIGPRVSCGHSKGEIYNGEMCYHIVTDVDLLNISLVTSPSQKYSVIFTSTSAGEQFDHYDYTLLRYVVTGLASPFDGWNYKHTTSEVPHTLYQGLSRNAACPCKSGKKYKHCCLKKPGVLRPRLEFTYEKQPPVAMPQDVYLGFPTNEQ